MDDSDDKSKAGRPPTEWDAASYHRLSAPQFSWGLQVLERLRLDGDEAVMDAGCGTGRLTALLLERLRSAGFVEVETSLEPALTVLSGADEFREFLTTVNLHAHLARLPGGHLRRRFVKELTEQAAHDDPPYSLDYCRLNMSARRPQDA